VAQRLGLFLCFCFWTRHYHTGDVNEHVSTRLQALVLHETTNKCKRIMYILFSEDVFYAIFVLNIIPFKMQYPTGLCTCVLVGAHWTDTSSTAFYQLTNWISRLDSEQKGTKRMINKEFFKVSYVMIADVSRSSLCDVSAADKSVLCLINATGEWMSFTVLFSTSVCTHLTAGEPPNGYSWNWMLGIFTRLFRAI
jgi:hypothetical protein